MRVIGWVKMPTFIDGIGASENIDSSGERIIIAGMDISSLAVDGVFNYEHDQATDAQGNKLQIKLPQNVVGKILKAKKIFSEKDCDDDRELYYWQKCQVPYIYIMGELFDDYKESAKEVAGMFRYDHDRKDQNERKVMNFSIEGGKLNKVGIDIVKSLGRKVTITVLACNKASIAEMVPNEAAKPKDDLDGIFKTEPNVEIELFKTENMDNFMDSLKKSAPRLSLAPAPTAQTSHVDYGSHIGTTKSGKPVYSHAKIAHYASFSSQDHKDAANHHYNMVGKGDLAANRHHLGKMKLHTQASAAAERREQQKTHVREQYLGSLKKAIGAGSGMAAPGQLTGTAATTPQSLDKKLQKGHPTTETAKDAKNWPQQNPSGNGQHQKGVHSEYDQRGESLAGFRSKHNKVADVANAKVAHTSKLAELKSMPKPNLTKSEDFWFKRAEDEYNNWDKKDQFVEFMAERMPQLTKTEIDVLGATLALKKALNNEQILEDMAKSLKFDFKPSGNSEDGTPKSKVPEHHKGKAPDIKGTHHTEVEHVEPHYSGSHDTIYLKSGHRSEHQPTGKYKVGDKVTIKQHIMGTHILEHGHNK
jgi:hypothetical protein